MIRAAKNACAGISRTSLVKRYVQRLERREAAASLRLRVLTYHRIGRPEGAASGDPKLFSATPEAFRAQLDLLAEHYTVVAMDEVLAAIREQRLLPPRAVLITFDDAYPDFESVAWPLLRQRKLPVTLFVPTAYPDCEGADFWWDRLARAVGHADRAETIDAACGRFRLHSQRRRHRALMILREHVKTLPHAEAMEWVDRLCVQLCAPRPAGPATLGWDALRRLRDQGVAVGAHTRTHPLLNRISGRQLEDEVFGAKHDLERHLGPCPPLFAYPAGAVGPEAARVVRDAGFEFACTTRPGIHHLGTDDPLQIHRFHVSSSTTASLLRTRLARG